MMLQRLPWCERPPSLIHESIITTIDRYGRVHIAAQSIVTDGNGYGLAPSRPSTTFDNLRAIPFAVASHTDDVRVFAGCSTGRRDWPLVAVAEGPVPRLAAALSHMTLAVAGVDEDEIRPRFRCNVVGSGIHAPFRGFNRAQAAVIEAAILTRRLHLLSREKVECDMAFLEAAVEETGGPIEAEAWDWVATKVAAFYPGRERPC